jgi:Leucine-rich repeat (LRR) protein
VLARQDCASKNLELLNLACNEIESIPDEVGQSQVNEINLNQNKLRKLNDSLVKCPKLKVLRLDNNMLEVTAITKPILADSKICLLSVENNLFTLEQLQERDGYDQYSERYTSTKRKLI